MDFKIGQRVQAHPEYLTEDDDPTLVACGHYTSEEYALRAYLPDEGLSSAIQVCSPNCIPDGYHRV